MDWYQAAQALHADATLIDEQFDAAAPDPDQNWAALRARVESGTGLSWSPWVGELLDHLERIPAAERLQWCEDRHRGALIEGLVRELGARYSAEDSPEGTQFSAERLWTALCDEMTRKVGAGDVPQVTGTARSAGRRILEVAWYAALGQHQPGDAFDHWVHRCLDTAQRNIGVDLARPEVLEALREDTGGAFATLRQAIGPVAEALVSAGASRTEAAGRAPAAQAAGEDALDGDSLRILFGEVDMQAILEDERLTETLGNLVGSGRLQIGAEELDELPEIA